LLKNSSCSRRRARRVSPKFVAEKYINMDEETSKKLDEIYRSVEKTRKMFLWTLILAAAFFVLPLIGLMFAIPQFLNIYNSALNF
jgi:hypothetical protein